MVLCFSTATLRLLRLCLELAKRKHLVTRYFSGDINGGWRTHRDREKMVCGTLFVEWFLQVVICAIAPIDYGLEFDVVRVVHRGVARMCIG